MSYQKMIFFKQNALILVLILCIVLPSVRAAFTKQTCEKDMCIGPKADISNPATYCASPRTYAVASGTSCPVDSQFSSVLTTHLSQNHSIAYYGFGDVYLGDANWTVPQGMAVYVCSSGVAPNEAPKTLCAWAEGNDALVGEHDKTYCMVADAPIDVVDGCYSSESMFSSGVVNQC